MIHQPKMGFPERGGGYQVKRAKKTWPQMIQSSANYNINFLERTSETVQIAHKKAEGQI